jgi:hypothetical protein
MTVESHIKIIASQFSKNTVPEQAHNEKNMALEPT